MLNYAGDLVIGRNGIGLSLRLWSEIGLGICLGLGLGLGLRLTL